MESTSNRSRPKVHRMPENVQHTKGYYVSQMIRIAFICLLVASAAAVMWYQAPSAPTDKQVASDAAHATAPAAQSIAVSDESGQMVGELTKMPNDIEHGANISATAKVDQRSGKELLKIISKY